MIVTYKLVLSLVIVFILVWLFIRTIDKRKWLTIILTIIVTPIVYFYLFYPLLNIFSSYHHEKHFNSKQWIDKPALRYEMINEVLRNRILTGKTKTEIITLLGTSEWLSWDEALKAKSENKWNYNLGFKPGAFNTMQECIELVFNKNKVEFVRRYQIKKEFE